MKVVLLDDVDNLGEAGEVVTVKPGYGRNWLIPNKLADFARPDVLNRIGQIKKAGEERRLARLKEEKEIIERLTGKSITIYMRAGQENRLFGAVTNQTVSDALKASFGTDLNRKFVRLASPIKHLGEYVVELRASSEIKGEIKVVIKSEDERESDIAQAAASDAASAPDESSSPAEG
ncbi:MAG: 50S ribosomal protein L9 [bacterium]|jgi:large subunit ribosomal protein L9